MTKTKTRKNVKSTRSESKSLSLGQKIGKALLAYFTTQFILMILVGVATWGILSLLDVRYAVILGVITGALSGVPNIGMIFATAAIVLVAIFDKVSFWPNSSPIIEGILVMLIFIFLNKVVDFILAPIFLGKAVKVNPIILLLVILLGTIFLGPAGAILAAPIYIVVKIIVEHSNK